MAGRISEYLDAGKLTGDELVDFSVVDAGSPTGYSTRKKTLADVAAFNPTLYSASSDLLGNRTVNQDGNTLFFNDGDFGLDFGNDGFIYEDLTRRVGIGTDTPLASTHIKAQSGDDLLLIETSLSLPRFIQNEIGQISTGANTNALINTNYGQRHNAKGYIWGFGFYPNNCSVGILSQNEGTTPTGIRSTMASNAATQTAIHGQAGKTEASRNYGVHGTAEDAAVTSYGLYGYVSNNSVASPLSSAVKGELFPRMDSSGEAGNFHARPSHTINQVFQNNTLIAVKGFSEGSENPSSSNNTIIGGQFRTLNGDVNISLLVPSTDNDGVVCFGQDTRQGDSILQTTGGVRMQGLPTSSAGLATGELYNDAGTLKIA